MIVRLLSVIATFSAVGCSVAYAQSQANYRGSQLYAFCESASDLDKARCEGYIDGVATAIADSGLSKISVCLPNGATTRHLVLVVTKSMKENPSILHHSAAANIAIALKEAFPCSR